MNDFMSMGIHRCWKTQLINEIGILGPKYTFKDGQVTGKEKITVLDVACGTGDITFKLIESQKKSLPNPGLIHENFNFILSDINKDIQEIAKAKSKTLGLNESLLQFNTQSAESLSELESNSVDLYVISFGLRNIPDIPKALKDAH